MPSYAFVPLFAVDAFGILTGWFGCRFSPVKILRLYAVALWAAVVGVVLRRIAVGNPEITLLEVCRQFRSFWFLHAYVMMMMFAPVADGAFEASRGNPKKFLRVVAPAIFVIFVWRWLGVETGGLALFRLGIPPLPGLPRNGYSGIMLFGCYMAGRALRILDDSGCRMPLRAAWAVFFAGLAVSWGFTAATGSGFLESYISPMMLAMAVASFEIFRRARLGGGRIACFVAPSVFAIYLSQVTLFGISCTIKLNEVLSSYTGIDGFPAAAVVTLALTILPLVADILRRFAISAVRRTLRKVERLKG